MNKFMFKITSPISHFFKFNERSATFKKEFIGGLSTFLAMAYILAVNPSILSSAKGAQNYAGVFFLTTAIAAGIATIAMGMISNVPVALAPGMGVNAFFAYTVAGSVLGFDVQQALMCTFASGILYAFIVILPVRRFILNALPKNIKLAIGAMIGLFLAYVGLNNSGIIVSGAFGVGHDVAVSNVHTKLGNLSDPFVIIALCMLVIVFLMHYLKVPGAVVIAMIIGIAMLSIAGAAGNHDASSTFKIQKYGSFAKFGELQGKLWNSFGSTLSNGKAYIAIFVFLYIDFFDTTGSLFAIDGQAKLSKTDPKWISKANSVDAGATIMGAIMLTSTTTVCSETSVGISQGSRTGLSSVFTGLLFFAAISLWPILSPIMPIQHMQHGVYAQGGSIMPITGPISVLIGSLMIIQLRHFDWKQSIDIPVLFITMVFGSLGFSISTGIAAGIVMFYLINLTAYVVESVRTHFGKTFEINDEEIVISEVPPEKTKKPNFKSRVLNITLIVLFALALVYFITIPFYEY